MPLYICPTPIGNLEDITLRVIRILGESDAIFAEDTRRTMILLEKYNIKGKKLYSYNKDNWRKRLPLLMSFLSERKNISLVSDAGTPGISDMGIEAIRACVDKGYHVEVLPGPTAFVPALLLSAFDPHPFLFYGFLPSQKSKRRKALSLLRDFPFTLVFYESPHRISETLYDILDILGDRRACVVREISKLHEEAIRGRVSEIAKRADALRGEMVIVVEGKAEDSEEEDEDALKRRVKELLGKGLRAKDIAERIHFETGISKRKIYQMVIKMKGGNET